MEEEADPDGAPVDVMEMLQLQLSEFDMLQSMFPESSEMSVDDPTALVNIRAYTEGTIKYEFLHSRIGFTMQVTADDCQTPVELVFQLPHEYPAVPPVVFTRASNMTRENHRKLNEQLHDFIISLDRGEICIYPVIEWLKENLIRFQTSEVTGTETTKAKVEEDSLFTRLWIYSHHIYSKFKRRDIIDWAGELKLSGFSLPGKPGVVCVEGYSRPVDDYWHRLRRCNWKRLVIKEKEEQDIGDQDINKFRKFADFQEKVFDVRGGKGREYHMDLGMLSDYLKEHDSSHIFHIYFGVEGTKKAS